MTTLKVSARELACQPRLCPGAETVPHRSLDYLAGREDGYSEGVNRIARRALTPPPGGTKKP